MSIVRTGFRGWKYQYIASVYISLQYLLKYEIISITVDAPNTEDCQIQFREKGVVQIQTAEIQCKNWKPELMEQKFSEIITHFEDSSVDTNLLSKLADGKVDRVHLIYSGRISDFAKHLNIFANKYVPDEKEAKPITQKRLISLANCIKKVLEGSTTIQDTKRHAFNGLLAKRLIKNKPLFLNVLERTYVTDQLPRDIVEYEIKALLEKRYRVPAANTEKCYTDLLTTIEDNTGSTTNILAHLQKILSKYKAGSIGPAEGYIRRGDEEGLLQILKEKHILLLTGISRCGKTQLARELASGLVENVGMAHLETSDPNEANRYLSENSTEERVCLLEDPFGQHPGNTNLAQYKYFENLQTNLPIHQPRYLIVTSRKEVVDASAITKYLPWQILNVTDRLFIKKIWEQLVSRFTIGSKLNNAVLDVLNTDLFSDLLQPGELNFLAGNVEKLQSIDPESIKHFARSSAEDIASLISKEDYSYVELFTILGLTATTLTGPTLADLRYILGKNEGYFPGLFKENLVTSYFGFSQDEEVYTIPHYQELSPLSTEVIRFLEDMVNKEYILEKGDVYTFSHPIYQESARQFLNNKANTSFQRTLVYVNKCISLLNPLAAVNAIKSLYVFFSYQSFDQKKTQAIVSIAFEAIHSIFVSVQDVGQLFIVSKYEQLNKQQREDIYKRLSRGFSHSYYWDDEIVFVPPVRNQRYLPDLEARFLSKEDFERLYKIALIGGKTKTRDAWLILNYMGMKTRHRKQRISYDPDFLSKFLIYNETFIREAAAFLLASSYTANYFKQLSSLLELEDPFVIFQLIKGAIRAYPYLTKEDSKVEFIRILLNAYDNPTVVSRSIPLMTQFASGYSRNAFDWRDDIEEKAIPAMWYIWGEMIPILFMHLAPETFIDEGRFSAALQESSKWLSGEQQHKLIFSWLGWCTKLSKEVVENRFVNTLFNHFLWLFEDLLAKDRLEITRQLLEINHSSLVSKLVNALVYRYLTLSKEEQSLLTNFLLQSESQLQMIALVSEGASPEIQNSLTGHSQLDSLSTTELIGVISERQLTEALILVFPPDNYTEVAHVNLSAWRKHLNYFLNSPGHPLFQLAIQRIIFDTQHSPGTLDELKPDYKSILSSIFSKPNQDRNEMIFVLLLNELIDSNTSIRLLFTVFFANLTKDDRIYFGERLAEYIEAITYAENLDQIPKSIFVRFIKPHLSNDLSVSIFTKVIAESLSKNKTPTTSEIEFLQKLLEIVRLRDYSVIDDLDSLARNKPDAFPTHLVSKITSLREEILSRSEAQNQKIQKLLLNIQSAEL